MLKEVDTRGRSCPEPVLLTKKALALSPEGVLAIADNATASENIRRFAQGSGYKVEETEDERGYLLRITGK